MISGNRCAYVAGFNGPAPAVATIYVGRLRSNGSLDTAGFARPIAIAANEARGVNATGRPLDDERDEVD